MGRLPTETLRSGLVFDACCALLPGVDPCSLEVQVSSFRHAGQCQWHCDRDNLGLSVAAFMGGFTAGGGLRTRGGRVMARKYCWHLFDGVREEHCVGPWPGGEERLSIVAFSRRAALDFSDVPNLCPGPGILSPFSRGARCTRVRTRTRTCLHSVAGALDSVSARLPKKNRTQQLGLQDKDEKGNSPNEANTRLSALDQYSSLECQKTAHT